MAKLVCERPDCSGTPLIPMNLESTLTVKKHYCPNKWCGRVYVVTTPIGKVGQLSGLASIGMLAVSLATLDYESVIQHAKDAFESL